MDSNTDKIDLTMDDEDLEYAEQNYDSENSSHYYQWQVNDRSQVTHERWSGQHHDNVVERSPSILPLLSNDASVAATIIQSDDHTNHTDKCKLLLKSNFMIFNACEKKQWSCKKCKRQYKWKSSLSFHIKHEYH